MAQGGSWMLLKCHGFTSFLMCCLLVYRHTGDCLKCAVSFFAAVTDDELYAVQCVCVCVWQCSCFVLIPSEFTFILGPRVTLQHWKRHRRVASSSSLWHSLLWVSVEKLRCLPNWVCVGVLMSVNKIVLLSGHRSCITFQFLEGSFFFLFCGHWYFTAQLCLPFSHVTTQEHTVSCLLAKSIFLF